LDVDFPGEVYSMTRFDWTGLIREVRYKGQPITGRESPQTDRDTALGCGCYNEFGIEGPIGFQEAAPGDWVHKIGVGLLRKEHPGYDFHHGYELRPAQFETSTDKDTIRTACSGPEHNGFGYRLDKRIEVLEDGFAVHYALHNTGTKPFASSEYNHNFIALDQGPIDTRYRLDFGFAPNPDGFGESVNPEGAAVFEGSALHFRSCPSEPVFFSNLTGGKAHRASWTMRCASNGLSLSETGDFETASINVWSNGRVLSPELFIQLELLPGTSRRWSRRYRVVTRTP
jgi:hypothetical protein